MRPPLGDLSTPFTVISFTSSPGAPAGRAPLPTGRSPPRAVRLTNGSRRPAGSYEYPASPEALFAPCGAGGGDAGGAPLGAAGGGGCGAAGFWSRASEFFFCAASVLAFAAL